MRGIPGLRSVSRINAANVTAWDIGYKLGFSLGTKRRAERPRTQVDLEVSGFLI